ncbi:MAG: hypothetical protein IJV19_06970 [Prevotella sp.]|nr:hypothetical protein [Prevotella sp.]
MYALSFDMNIADLEEHYGKPYHGAYYEIKHVLVKHGFYDSQERIKHRIMSNQNRWRMNQ